MAGNLRMARRRKVIPTESAEEEITPKKRKITGKKARRLSAAAKKKNGKKKLVESQPKENPEGMKKANFVKNFGGVYSCKHYERPAKPGPLLLAKAELR